MSVPAARTSSFTKNFETPVERVCFKTVKLEGDEFAIITRPLAPPLIVHFDGDRLTAAEIDPHPRAA